MRAFADGAGVSPVADPFECKDVDDAGAVPEWTIRNDSALPVRLTKVIRSGIDTFNADSGEVHDRCRWKHGPRQATRAAASARHHRRA